MERWRLATNNYKSSSIPADDRETRRKSKSVYIAILCRDIRLWMFGLFSTTVRMKEKGVFVVYSVVVRFLFFPLPCLTLYLVRSSDIAI